jgi:hypothetical protein
LLHQPKYFFAGKGTPTEVKDYKALERQKIFLQTASTLSNEEVKLNNVLGRLYPN